MCIRDRYIHSEGYLSCSCHWRHKWDYAIYPWVHSIRLRSCCKGWKYQTLYLEKSNRAKKYPEFFSGLFWNQKAILVSGLRKLTEVGHGVFVIVSFTDSNIRRVEVRSCLWSLVGVFQFSHDFFFGDSLSFCCCVVIILSFFLYGWSTGGLVAQYIIKTLLQFIIGFELIGCSDCLLYTSDAADE